MGHRSNIVIRETASQKDNFVILYGHWAGDDNLTAVRNVLEKTDRIGDSTYLTAQIFHEFTRLGNYDGGLGFGLWVGDMETIDEADNPAVIIDCDTGAITYKGETVEPCECNSCVAFH
jgi:hypothetical protein